MSRPPRRDHPGAWHHVFNRGIAKRPMFERSDDVLRFLDLLGSTVATGVVEVHAYCLLTSHFHLLVRSIDGQLSRAMHLVQNTYSRSFNRARRRDGPLVRGRFASRMIDDSAYWESVVRYIDANPVSAGICELPSDYPHGSASSYRFGRGPEWLTRTLVEAVVAEALNTPTLVPETYDAWASSTSIDRIASIVDARRDRSEGPLRYDDLIRSASPREQAWMRFKARLADGERIGSVLLAPATIAERVARRRARRPGLRSASRTRPGSYWDVFEAGLLRDFCRLRLAQIGDRQGCGESAAHSRHVSHRRRLAHRPGYRMLVARVVRGAMAEDLPPPRRALERAVGLPETGSPTSDGCDDRRN